MQALTLLCSVLTVVLAGIFALKAQKAAKKDKGDERIDNIAFDVKEVVKQTTLTNGTVQKLVAFKEEQGKVNAQADERLNTLTKEIDRLRDQFGKL